MQFSDLLDKVYNALEARGIGVARVKGTALNQMKVMTNFQNKVDPHIWVLLLHATGLSASGEHSLLKFSMILIVFPNHGLFLNLYRCQFDKRQLCVLCLPVVSTYGR